MENEVVALPYWEKEGGRFEKQSTTRAPVYPSFAVSLTREPIPFVSSSFVHSSSRSLQQDGPPPGGYPSVRYARRIPSTGPTGVAFFGAYLGLSLIHI